MRLRKKIRISERGEVAYRWKWWTIVSITEGKRGSEFGGNRRVTSLVIERGYDRRTIQLSGYGWTLKETRHQ